MRGQTRIAIVSRTMAAAIFCFFAFSLVAQAAPSISSFSPSYGPVGTQVTINGSNFAATASNNNVRFNGVLSGSVGGMGSTRINAVVPSGATTGPISVTYLGQTGTSANSFRVTGPPPTITSFTPSGPPGSTMTITGTNFSTYATAVYFTDASGPYLDIGATPTSITATSLTVVVPSGIASGPFRVITYDAGGETGRVDSTTNFIVTVPTPTITSFSPTVGPVGTQVAINGTNFDYNTPANNAVLFNGTAAAQPMVDASGTVLTATVPNGATTGPITVMVNSSSTQIAGASVTSSSNYTVGIPPPTITSFTPTNGIAGTLVTISGTHFGAAQGSGIVQLAGNTINVASWSDTAIAVTIPSSSAGVPSGPFTIALSSGQSVTSSGSFTVRPAISSFSPSSGPVGTTVTIAGSGFSTTPASNTVTFNGVAATVASATGTSLTVTVPSAATAGAGPIAVTVSGNTATSGSNFTVIPGVTGFSPVSGAGGTAVTITGTNFSATAANNTVKFNGVAATVTSATTTSLSTSVPIAATTGPVSVTVNSLTGTSASNFTVPAPTISSFSPTIGPPGTTVTITGTNFSPSLANNGVYFTDSDGVAIDIGVTPTAVTATTLTVTAPNAYSGKIRVITPAGSATSTSAFTVTVPKPTISSFTPTIGPAGTVVTINGTNFDGNTPANNVVSFNGATVAVSAATSTSLTATVPSNATSGPIAVTVSSSRLYIGSSQSNASTSNYTVGYPQPTITSFTPTSGGEGAKVTITGTNFGTDPYGAGYILMGTAPVAVLSWADTSIQIQIPYGLQGSGGPFTVTTPHSMTVTSAQSFQYSAPPPPTLSVTGISPIAGPFTTVVTIKGTGFSSVVGGNKVTFSNGVLVPDAQVTPIDSVHLQVVVPPAAQTGAIGVVVGAQSASSPTFTVVPSLALSAQYAGQLPFNVAGMANTIPPGATTDIKIMFRNTGTTTWTSAQNFKLGQTSTDWNWTSSGRVSLSASVAPGDYASISFTATAPSTPGVYNFCWMMLQDNPGNPVWFGDMSCATVQVGLPSDYPNAPASIAATPIASGVALGWTAPPSGGATATKYRVAYRFDVSGPWYVAAEVPAAQMSLALPMSPRQYYFGVAACTNADLCSAYTTTGPVTVSDSGTPTTCVPLTVSPNVVSFPASGGSAVTLSVSAPAQCAWSVSSTAAGWLRVEPMMGPGTTITLTPLGPNSSLAALTGTLTISGSGVSTVVAVSQAGAIPGGPPTIQSFSPPSGYPGDTVTITGSNFSPNLTENIVRLNGMAARVTNANSSGTTLTIIVPYGVLSGPFSVTVGGQTGISNGNFGMPSADDQRKFAFSNLTVMSLGKSANATGPAGSLQAPEEYAKLVKSGEAVNALNSGLFGESVNLFTGATEFAVTDVSLPGNNALPVSVGRRRVIENRGGGFAPFAMSDWDLEVPYMSGVYAGASGWTVDTSAPQNRCSSPTRSDIAGPPDYTSVPGMPLTASQFWLGTSMHVPGVGSQEVLFLSDSTISHPSDGSTYHWVTRDQWFFSCAPLADGSEGFVAHAPDGTIYTFDHQVNLPYSILVIPNATASGDYVVPRAQVRLYASKVTDRFGNTVTYNWTDGRLNSIVSSDGRRIDLTWNDPAANSASIAAYPWGNIATVTDGSRTWHYVYSTTPSTELTNVVLPDNSQWTIDDHVGWGDIFYDNNIDPSTHKVVLDQSLYCSWMRVLVSNMATITFTHPSGATGVFSFDAKRHGRSGVPLNCTTPQDGATPDTYSNWIPPRFDVLSISQKTISGPGLPGYRWSYGYNNLPIGGYAGDVNAIDTKTVTVTEPDGTRREYTYGIKYGVNEAQLLTTKTFAASANTLLRTETTSYVASSEFANNGLPFPDQMGISPQTRADTFFSEHLRPQREHAIAQDGVTFTNHTNSYDLYANPLSMTRSNSLGAIRTDVTSYSHNTSLWVLGQVASVTEQSTGAVVVSNNYDASTANLLSVTRFGRLDLSATYYADGTLETISDATPHTTTYSNYKRGIAQNVAYADGKSESAVVNNIGRITSITDANSYITSFGYDAMGRLASITYPSDSGQTWNSTTLDFSQINTSEMGLGAGHWRQTIQTGNAKKTSYFDAFWQPLLTVEEDTGDATTKRYVSHSFDHAGRETFAAFPASSATSVTSLTSGTHQQYDALGRLTQSQQNSERGLLTTSIEWQSNFQRKVTDPNSNVTTTTFQVFDAPNEEAPLSIFAPEGVTTTIARDLFGKPTSITRADANTTLTRNYVYDANQRLCKSINPETASTIVDYDSANNVAWRATGQALPNATSCDRTSVAANQKTTFGYDARNRLTSTSFGDNSAGITRDYTPDGLDNTITSGATTWTYSYNHRRLPTGESLSLSGTSYPISYGYDANGHLNLLTWPDGNLIGVNPNALGQAKQLGVYASGIGYFANGAVSGFTYGNGIAHSLTQNTRGLPSESKDTNVLDDQYTYDNNANVTQISDLQQGGLTTRSMSYDGLNRLKTTQATSLWGSASYGYDALDNLTSSTVGSRSYTHVIDASNRLSALSGSSSISYGYDARGNLTTRGSQTYSFDQANRLATSSTGASYMYDGLGRRAKITNASGDKVQVYSKAGQLMYETSVAGTTRYVYLDRHLIAKVTGGTATYIHTDGLGSPVATTDQSGAITSRSNYEPFGQPYNQAVQDGPGYTGHVMDADTGLSYMQQRYYDPIAGRFLSDDPVTTDMKAAANFNRYAYALNNPYRYVDPNGRWTCSSSDAANCDNFEKGLGKLDEASRSDKLSASEREMLHEIVSFFGAKGDDNVRVEFNNGIKGSGDHNRLSENGKTFHRIRLNESSLRRGGGDSTYLNRLASTTTHEGKHGVVSKHLNRDLNTKDERRESERSAYRAEAVFYKGIDILPPDMAWTPLNGINEKVINESAEESIRLACSGHEEDSSCN